MVTKAVNAMSLQARYWPMRRYKRNSGTVSIDPGGSVEIRVQAPAGTYLFHRRIRGHAGMRGTMIVQPHVVETT